MAQKNRSDPRDLMHKVNKARNFVESKNIDAAWALYQEIEPFLPYLERQNPAKAISIYQDMGKILSIKGQTTVSIEYELKALATGKRIYGEESLKLIKNYNRTANRYLQLGNHEKEDEYRQLAYNLLAKNPEKNPKELRMFCLSRARHELKSGRTVKSLGFLQQIIEYSDSTKDKTLAEAYFMLGRIAARNSEKQKALHYQNLGLSILKTLNIGVFEIYKKTGDRYFLMQQYDSAKFYFKQSLQSYERPHRTERYGDVYRDLGRAYFELQDYDSALFAFRSSNNILDQTKVAPNKYDVNNLWISKCLAIKDHPYKALEVFLEVYDPFEHLLPTNRGNPLSLLNTLARLYLKVDSTNKADEVIMLANQLNQSQVGPEQQLYDLNEYLNTQSIKGSIHYRRFQQSNDTEQLRLAYQAMLTGADQITHYPKFDLLVEDSWGYYLKFEDFYEQTIVYGYELWEHTQESELPGQILQVSDQSKSRSLRNSFSNFWAKRIVGVPDSLLQYERLLKERISELKGQVNLKTTKDNLLDTGDSTAILLYQEIQQYQKFVDQLQRRFPEYHQLAYQSEGLNVEHLQDQLTANQVFADFYWASEHLYITKVSSKELTLKRIPVPEDLSLRIENLHQALRSNNLNDYKKVSYWLYESIIEHLSLPSDVNRLVIAPHKRLWDLNFDVLSNGTSYLTQHLAISYAYAPGLWLVNKQNRQLKKAPLKSVLGLYFINQAAESAGPLNLSSLPGSLNEVSAVRELLDGDFINSWDVGETWLKQSSSNYKILHLAVHGTLDATNPMKSNLLLGRPGASDDGILYAYELYNMSLNADLAVLSACYSGAGPMTSGEGLLSLGRAFSYAGCHSLVSAAWELNDDATALILKNFYQNLMQGMPKDVALQNAKIAYLDQADNITQHPYFWAGLSVIGDEGPIDLTINTHWQFQRKVILLLIITVIILLLLWLYRKHQVMVT